MIENYGENRIAGIIAIAIFGAILWFLGNLPAIFKWVAKNAKALPQNLRRVSKKDLVLTILTLGIYPLIKLSDRWAPVEEIKKDSVKEPGKDDAVIPLKKEDVPDKHSGLAVLFFTISGLILVFTDFPLGRGLGYAFGNLVAVLLGYSLVLGLISFVISSAANKSFWFILSILFLLASVIHLGTYILESAISRDLNQMLLEDLYK